MPLPRLSPTHARKAVRRLSAGLALGAVGGWVAGLLKAPASGEKKAAR